MERFLITRPHRESGLGANLLSLAAALHAADHTRRTLIVDWTEMVHLVEPRTNYFPSFFEPIRQWGAIAVRYVNDPDLPSESAVYDQAQVFRATSSEHYAHLLSGVLEHPLVLLEPFHYRLLNTSGLTASEIFHYTRRFYQRLVLRPALRRRVDEAQQQFDGRLVIGLHVRSGNGEFAPGRQYWNRVNTAVFDHAAFLERIAQAAADCAAGYPAVARVPLVIFVATDALEMQQRLLPLPGAFALRRRFPPPGAGHQFAGAADIDASEYSDIDAAHETILDMVMLARCQGLVCNESEYNRYGRYMTMFYGGHMRLLERYFEPAWKRLARRATGRT